jgi:hypothetical protein
MSPWYEGISHTRFFDCCGPACIVPCLHTLDEGFDARVDGTALIFGQPIAGRREVLKLGRLLGGDLSPLRFGVHLCVAAKREHELPLGIGVIL